MRHELVFFFKQKTAYDMRISDWSSDVCSSDRLAINHGEVGARVSAGRHNRHRSGPRSSRLRAKLSRSGNRAIPGEVTRAEIAPLRFREYQQSIGVKRGK